MTHTKGPDENGTLWVSPTLAAQLCGVEKVTFKGWATQENPPPRGADGWYPAKGLGEWIRMQQTLRRGQIPGTFPYRPAHLVDMAGRSVLPPTGQVEKSQKQMMDDAKLRKEEAAAEKLEMENEVMRGELLQASDVKQAWANILAAVKTRLLQVPYAAAPLVVGSENVITAQGTIMKLQRDALGQLSADWQNLDGDNDEEI